MNEDKLKLKYEVFEALHDKKKKEFDEISNFQRDQLQSINDADLDNSELLENQTENMMREMRTESESLDHLKKEVNYLEDFKSFAARETIGPATLVKTNIGNFVISVPELLFEVNGEKYTGISTESPLYETLEGKKEGDKLEFNGQELEIHLVV